MKLIIAAACLLASAALAVAQRIRIGAPAEWTTVAPGESITVRVERPMTLSSANEVAVAIGFWPCGGGHCAEQEVQEVLGNVAYKGAYDPQMVEPWIPPYQNFIVEVPSHFQPPMEVSVGVAHFSLVGAGQMPFMEVANFTLNLAEAS